MAIKQRHHTPLRKFQRGLKLKSWIERMMSGGRIHLFRHVLLNSCGIITPAWLWCTTPKDAHNCWLVRRVAHWLPVISARARWVS